MNKGYKFIEKGDIRNFIEFYKSKKRKFQLNKDGFHFLHYACIEGQIEFIDFLLKDGIDINLLSKNGYSAIIYAIINGHIDVVRYFLVNGYINQKLNGFLSLITAAGNNQLDILKVLVDAGLNINEKDRNGKCFSPLHYAAQEGNFEIVEFLIKKGAEINMIDEDGLSPLRMASDWEHYKIVKYLIDNGADINLGESLHNACSWGRFKMVKLLIEKGLNINAIDNDGQTAIFYAVIADNHKIVSYLLTKGAKKDIINKNGETIYDICNSLKIKRLLLS